ncbi:MAG: nicotinate-nucleotide adenylyltransferase [Kiritimatiellae bacterium]|nr:nicotinate-nucleotide adenylyltransferase [Kiritimatiellia bacterium]
MIESTSESEGIGAGPAAESAKKVGVFGGTFNPIHLGHLILGQTALESCGLSSVLFIPCSKPPHKTAKNLASAHHRLAMVELAIEGDFRFRVSDIEIRRGGVSYAIDTIRSLRATDPSAAYYFLIGTDTLLELHLWKNIDQLLTLCTFVAFARPGVDLRAIGPEHLKLPGDWGERLLSNVVMSRQIDISSSDIRHRVAEGLSIRYLVPFSVEMYIAEHRLYQGAFEDTE